MNTVQPRNGRAAILARGAPTGGNFLNGRIRDRVAGSGTRLALENVEKTEPMADLVRSGAAKVVVGGTTAWDGVGEHVAAIFQEGGAGSVSAGGGGEVADAEEAAAEVGEEVDV